MVWANPGTGEELEGTVQKLAPRWFLVRSAYYASGAVLLQPRVTMSYMRGPMTRSEIKRARQMWEEKIGVETGGQLLSAKEVPISGGGYLESSAL